MFRRVPGLMTTVFAVLTATAALVPAAAGDTFTVNPNGTGDYATIQEAIDAAVAGDIIELTNGTFSGVGNKNLDFGGKAITVRSVSGIPSLCVIECQFDGRGFYFHSGEGLDSVVEGLSVVHGDVDSGSPGGDDGGAVFCDNSSPTLTNCSFSHNAANGSGGGVCCYYSDAEITDCTITYNEAGGGGGISYSHCGYYNYDDDYPVLTDCTIANNTASNGGGVSCGSSGPELTRCTIRENAASSTGSTSGQGGGFSLSYSEPWLTDCTITDNSASNDGGGFYCDHSDPRLIDCEITENRADNGGGFYLYYDSDARLTGCTITWNSVTDYGYGCGGGFYIHLSEPTLTGCTIAHNSCYDSSSLGGGFCCYVGGNPTLISCKIQFNSANDGGGVYCFRSHADLTNCLITSNGAGDDGGGFYCYETDYGETSATLTNCTFMHNHAQPQGGPALACDSYGQAEASDVTLTNCIVWNGGGTQIRIYDNSVLTVTYSDIQDGWTGTGNIDADPEFVDPNQGDYHLGFGSPCIDAANNAAITEITDLDDDDRFFDDAYTADTGVGTPPIVDMGPYEFYTNDPQICLSAAWVHFVAAEDGANPADQTLSIHNCQGVGTLNWEVTEDCAWLTPAPLSGQATGEVDDVTLSVDIAGLPLGHHYCTLTVSDPNAINNPQTVNVTLQIIGTVYVDDDAPNDPGPGDPNVSDPDEDGSIDHPFDAIQDAIEIAYAGEVVEVADGVYTGYGNRDLVFGGKAITVRGTSGDPTLCVIDCQNEGRGFNFWCGEGPDSVVEAITITNGLATSGGGKGRDYNDGGGVYCEYSSPTLINCIISGNSAFNGGGVCCGASDATFINCAITGNTAAGDYDLGSGGGVYCAEGSPTLTNCTLTDNTAEYAGGGVYCEYSDPTITNCTFSGNSATDVEFGYGGGVYCETEEDNPTLTNTVFWDNCDSTGCNDETSQIYVSGEAPAVNYCCVEGWTGSLGGNGNIGADPLFLDPGADDYHLSAGSPCIDAADNSAVPADAFDLDGDGDIVEPLPFDLDGDPRFIDDPDTVDTGAGASPIVDMGAYEFQVEGLPGDLDGDGDVDLSDLATLLANYGMTSGATYADGDLDGDGDVDLSDLAALLAVFGTSS